MNSVNVENAVMQERKRQHQEIVRLSDSKGIVAGFSGEMEVVWIPREEVLKIINNNHE